MRKNPTDRPRDSLRHLPRNCTVEAIAGLGLATDAGRRAARLRVATRLARRLTDATLLAACRARGLRHVSTGVAAAHALAALAVPEDRPARATAAAAAEHPDPTAPPLDAVAEVLALVVARHAGLRDAAGHRLPGGALVFDEDGNGMAVSADPHPGDAREAARDALDLLAARGVTAAHRGGEGAR